MSAVRKGLPTPRKILGEINGYNITEGDARVDLQNFSLDQRAVVYNPRLDQVGVITGVFSLVLKEESLLIF